MNIKEAKQEISNTLRAYLEKDEYGNYRYSPVHQRPILLMGPPGIGKTAIMEQVAEENKVGLVAYSITHHTRQSAVGLPRIRDHIYDGQQVSVTEYTMSEIIDSVYACMEKTGRKEGILFIDEINCASETLAPTMLQFLQNKTFGSHRVPDGWIIVAAGNPPEYNKSVREFDIVTLDRVRRIDVEADCGTWMEYAWARQVHGAILSYLNIHREQFYHVEQTAEGKSFVTARGWEDLSELLHSYERLGIPISSRLMPEFLQYEETARGFAAYYELYQKYGKDYKIPQLAEGFLSSDERDCCLQMAAAGGFEERFTVVGLCLDYLNQQAEEQKRHEEQLHALYESLQRWKARLGEQPAQESLEQFIEEQRGSLEIRKGTGLMTAREAKIGHRMIDWLSRSLQEIKKEHVHEEEAALARMRQDFDAEHAQCKAQAQQLSLELDHTFSFLEEAFGDGQEMVLFVTELSRNETLMEFIGSHGCEAFFRHSDKLLTRRREKELLEKIERMENS